MSTDRLMLISGAATEKAGTELYLHIHLEPQPGVGGLSDYRTLCLRSYSGDLERWGHAELSEILAAVKMPQLDDEKKLIGQLVLFRRNGNGKAGWGMPVTDDLARKYFSKPREAKEAA